MLELLHLIFFFACGLPALMHQLASWTLAPHLCRPALAGDEPALLARSRVTIPAQLTGSNTRRRDPEYSDSISSASRSRRLQDAAHDLPGKCRRFGLQSLLGRNAIFLDVRLGSLHLRLCFVSRLGHGFGASLHRRLTLCFLGTENRRTRLAQTLLVLGGACLSCRDIRLRLFDRTLSLAVPFLKHAPQGLVHDHSVEGIQQRQHNYRRNRSEQ